MTPEEIAQELYHRKKYDPVATSKYNRQYYLNNKEKWDVETDIDKSTKELDDAIADARKAVDSAKVPNPFSSIKKGWQAQGKRNEKRWEKEGYKKFDVDNWLTPTKRKQIEGLGDRLGKFKSDRAKDLTSRMNKVKKKIAGE